MFLLPHTPSGRPAPSVATPFDPTHLAALLAAQWAFWPALAEAMRTCTRQWPCHHCYIYLLDPDGPYNSWDHRASVVVHCPLEGRIGVDVLAGDTIAGLDYLDRPLPQLTWYALPEEALDAPPLKVVHRGGEGGSS